MNEVCMPESLFPNSVQLTQQVHSYSSTPHQTIMMIFMITMIIMIFMIMMISVVIL